MINVHAVGRLTESSELRTTNSGRTVANFTLACKRTRTDQNNKPLTAFVRCILWGKPAQAFAKYTQKGTLIGVSGELQTRSYDDQQGRTHYVTELVVENFEFLESKETVQNREQKQVAAPQNEPTPPTNEPYPTQEPPYEQPPMPGMSQHGYNQ